MARRLQLHCSATLPAPSLGCWELPVSCGGRREECGQGLWVMPQAPMSRWAEPRWQSWPKPGSAKGSIQGDDQLTRLRKPEVEAWGAKGVWGEAQREEHRIPQGCLRHSREHGGHSLKQGPGAERLWQQGQSQPRRPPPHPHQSCRSSQATPKPAVWSQGGKLQSSGGHLSARKPQSWWRWRLTLPGDSGMEHR